MLKLINNMLLSKCDSIYWFDANGLEMEGFQNALAKRIGIDIEDKENLDKSCAIYAILKRLKFSILIDNLCFRLDFTELGIPLPDSTNKARIVFTTSNSKVYDYMICTSKKHILRLNQAAAWQLFNENNGKASSGGIKATAEKVVELCQGRPKTLVTVARALAHVGSPEEWEEYLEVLNACGSKIRGIHFPEPPAIDEANAFLEAIEQHMGNNFTALGLVRH